MSREDRVQLVAGIDVGASTTKGVILGKSGIIHQCFIETLNDKSSTLRILKKLLSRVDDVSSIKKVAVSGGDSRIIVKEFFGIPVQKVDEIAATGIGGLFLSGKNQALIVSVGTGTGDNQLPVTVEKGLTMLAAQALVEERLWGWREEYSVSTTFRI